MASSCRVLWVVGVLVVPLLSFLAMSHLFASVSPLSKFPRDGLNLLQKAISQQGVDFAGPESLAFDPNGFGPYTGVSDGRILRWDGHSSAWILFSTTSPNRVIRYWIRGPKAGKVEQFVALPGFPDNIRLTERDDFWVAIHAQPNWIMKLPVLVRRALLQLPVPLAGWYIQMARKQARGMVMRLGLDGQILEVLEDDQGKVAKLLSGIEEQDGVLWLGSVVLPQILKYKLR